jgi:tetraacyldisaccharide 4'-kinase
MRLIEKVWFQQHWAKWFLVPLLMPLTLLFWLLTLIRRSFYRLGVFKSFKISVPVIVVGNIGIGGNGKTPVVVFLIEQCQKLGLNVGIVSRGYGGNAPYYPYLLNKNSTAAEAGDEPVLIHARCNVPVVVGSDRVAAANLLVGQGCDIIVADDGLQHYRLNRDIELIVVDAKRKFGNGYLLPSGPLREGIWRLKTAGFVINNNAQGSSNLLLEKQTVTSNQLDMVLRPEFVCNVLTGEKISLLTFIQDNAKVNAMAGIGDPERFFNTLRAQKFELNDVLAFVDHHHFIETDLNHLSSKLPLLMTEKDAVKCKTFSKKHWWYVPVSAEFSQDDSNKLNETIQAVITAARQ